SGARPRMTRAVTKIGQLAPEACPSNSIGGLPPNDLIGGLSPNDLIGESRFPPHPDLELDRAGARCAARSLPAQQHLGEARLLLQPQQETGERLGAGRLRDQQRLALARLVMQAHQVDVLRQLSREPSEQL